MIETLRCCRAVGERIQSNPTLKRMAVFDWYDGPASGLLVCEGCGATFAFQLIDWSDDHAVRVFGLRRMPDGTLDDVSRLLREEVRWPLWFPARLKSPTEADRLAIDKLDALLALASPPSLVVGWSVPDALPKCARIVSPELTRNVVDLLAQASGRSGFDWLAYLGLNR